MTPYVEYGYARAHEPHAHSYVWPKVLELSPPLVRGTRVLDVGCGTGFHAAWLAEHGCTVVGVDMSENGIAIARAACPHVRFEALPADDRLLAALDEPPFDVVVSVEVIEHLYDPRAYARGCLAALRPGGRFVLSTPYHGYLKNLAVSLAGRWDAHADPLWDCGHIKLWSRRTLARLLGEAGFVNLQFRGAGRVPYLWMSMVMSADRPAAAT